MDFYSLWFPSLDEKNIARISLAVCDKANLRHMCTYAYKAFRYVNTSLQAACGHPKQHPPPPPPPHPHTPHPHTPRPARPTLKNRTFIFSQAKSDKIQKYLFN